MNYQRPRARTPPSYTYSDRNDADAGNDSKPPRFCAALILNLTVVDLLLLLVIVFARGITISADRFSSYFRTFAEMKSIYLFN